mmetsp:Transcript_15497/g.42822  ORF Transcript_15497/g.42822 Transcript_15497/m.42822 type:complete len:264 (-) Transcript_15497:82-873(-)
MAPMKKRRLEERGVADYTTLETDAQQHFLTFHLEVLKSLYTSVDDPNIDWRSVEEFLRNRATLLKCKGSAVRCRGIHQQALKYIQQVAHNNSADEQASIEDGPDMDEPAPASPSPSLLEPAVSPKENDDDDNDGEVIPKKRKHGFAIVAKFLEHRADAVEASLQDRVSKPYLPLLDLVKKQISILQKTKQRHQKVLLERQQTISREVLSINVYAASSQRGETVTDRIQESRRLSVDEQSKLAATESKLQLWSMLEKELMQVVL